MIRLLPEVFGSGGPVDTLLAMPVSRRADVAAELRKFFSGPRTVGDSAVPPIAFVLGNQLWGIWPGALAAIGVAVVIVAVRLARRRPLRYALGGVLGVAVAAAIAVRTDRAETYFLPGILTTAGTAVIAFASVVVGRPLIAAVSRLSHDWPSQWYRRPDVRPAYRDVTLMWAAFFAVKAAVQYSLFDAGRTEMLVVARVGFSWPAIVPLMIVSYLYGTRRLERLGGPSASEFAAGAEPPWSPRRRAF